MAIVFKVKPWYKKSGGPTYQGIWVPKTWNGLSIFNGEDVWSDGENIYYSNNQMGGGQYVLNKTTNTWSQKTWDISFCGKDVWVANNNVYESHEYYGSYYHYILNKSTSAWESHGWGQWYSKFIGRDVWTDGSNYYACYDGDPQNDQYVIKFPNNADYKWWQGANPVGRYVWTDGTDIFYSQSSQYVLNKNTNSWSTKTWRGGLTNFYGGYVWTDGTDTYYSSGPSQYVLDKATSTWSTKTWQGLTSFSGSYIWKDGDHIYYSGGSTQYELT